MSLPKSKFLTRHEYLAIERQAEEKSEFWDGEMFLMAGASEAHNLIVLNVGGELREQLKDRPCKVYPSDLRVRIPNTDRYVYPDVSVVCGKAQFEDEERDILLNPTVIVEVLSDSTEAYDRGKKFDNYLTIHSLREYLMIAQGEPHVYHFVRQPDNRWLFSEASQLDSVIQLDSIGCQLTVVEIYRNVEFSSAGQGEDVASNGA
jgi:Uma2 family endonuclease